MLSAATPVTVTAPPPAVTVKAAGGGRLADCRSSENASWMVFPSARTTALVSEGGARSVILMLTSVPAVQGEARVEPGPDAGGLGGDVGEGEGGAADNDGEVVGGGGDVCVDSEREGGGG